MGAFAALGLCGLLVLSACGSGGPPRHVAVRVGSVVQVGPYTQESAGGWTAACEDAGLP